MSDKQQWQRVKFGDVVKLNTERCANPVEAGIEHYVGLEHIEPEDLRIRRWGTVADGTTFTNLFHPGQTLFGKRRAYQRKVAVADFTGVCSGDIYIFEPKDPNLLLPELLPFICQTDSFFDYAVGTSAGSLSPRTNWTQLAQYEFALPPLDEQRRIADILMSLLDNENIQRKLLDAAHALETAFLSNIFGEYFVSHKNWQKVELKNAAYIQSGAAKNTNVQLENTVGVPYLAVSNVQDGFLDLSEIKYINIDRDRVEQYLLQPEDVLITEGGDPDKLGRGTVWHNEIDGCVHQNHIFAIRTHRNLLNPYFLAAVLRSYYGKSYFLTCAKRTSNLATINKQQVGSFQIPLPDLNTQSEIVEQWNELRTVYSRTTKRISSIKAMRRSISLEIAA